jgi:hypothetical protein
VEETNTGAALLAALSHFSLETASWLPDRGKIGYDKRIAELYEGRGFFTTKVSKDTKIT